MSYPADYMKSKTFLTTTLVLVTLTLAFMISPWKLTLATSCLRPKYSEIVIKADGSIEPSTAPILCDGGTYMLKANIENLR